jgi:hypothetical protein
MSKGDSARTHEETARAELIQRIQLRDNALVFFLAAVGAIIGVANALGVKFLLVIPYLAFGVAVILGHHDVMIGLLGHYLVNELEPYYHEIGEFAPQWDGSVSLMKIHRELKHFLSRKWGYGFLVGVPCGVSLAYNIPWLIATEFDAIVAWFLGLVLTAASIFYICASDKKRHKLYSRYSSEMPQQESLAGSNNVVN